VISAIARLVRIRTVICGSALVIVGEVVTRTPYKLSQVGLGVLGFASLIGFAQSFNDIVDRELDSREPSDRPLVTGELGLASAGVVCLACLVLAVCCGSLLNAVAVTGTLIVAALSAAYSVWLKSTVLFGNVVVAALAASPLLFPAVAGNSLNAPLLVGFCQTFVFLVGFEALKTLRDVRGDRAHGLRTLATRCGERRVVAAIIALDTTSLLLPCVAALWNATYLPFLGGLYATVAPCLVLSCLALARKARLEESQRVAKAVLWQSRTWLPGVICLLLLREAR
jgi:4-hydroxybenzoate polyprenyltransferase